MTRFAAIALSLVACGEKKAPPGSGSSSIAEIKEPKAPEWTTHVDLPVVDGYQPPAREDEPILVVTPTGIVFDGLAVLQLSAGRADPSELEGGALGMKLPRLTTFLDAFQAKHALASLRLAFDKQVPYRTFFQIVFSAKQKEAGIKQFALLAKTKQGSLVEAPFELPDRKPVSDGPRRPGSDLEAQLAAVKEAGRAIKTGSAQANDKELAAPKQPAKPPKRAEPPDEITVAHADLLPGETVDISDMPVGLVVTITKTEVMLWSFSGVEGTLKEPKLKVPVDGAVAPLRGTLEGIIARRWKDKRTEQTIVIMADGDTPMERVAEVIGAVRADAAGKPLFPDLNFSSGFE